MVLQFFKIKKNNFDQKQHTKNHHLWLATCSASFWLFSLQLPKGTAGIFSHPRSTGKKNRHPSEMGLPSGQVPRSHTPGLARNVVGSRGVDGWCSEALRLPSYCWWFRNPAHQLIWQIVYPSIYRVLYIPNGAGFPPSTVSLLDSCGKIPPNNGRTWVFRPSFSFSTNRKHWWQ